MKKSIILVLSALGIIGLATVGPRTQAVHAEATYIAGENIIHNGDFAIGPNEWKLPANYNHGVNTYGPLLLNEFTQVITSDPVNPENTVLRHSTYESAGYASMFVLINNIEAGATYNISFDYYAPAGCNNIGIAFYDVTAGSRLPEINVMFSGDVTTHNVTITDHGNGWKTAAWTRTFTEGHVYDSVHLWANVGAGHVYLDNITATKTDGSGELFTDCDFEGWLANASATVPTEADDNGIHGADATYVNGGVKLAPNGHIAYDVALTEDNYKLVVEYTAEAEEKLDAEFVGETALTKELVSGEEVLLLDGEITDYEGVKFVNENEHDIVITNIYLAPIYESTYDPSATYYESESLTVNGDFEAFEVGTVFSDTQLDGAWGSVAGWDNPARILDVDGSKAAVIGKHDEADSKTFSSMFLMTPEGLEIGDILRIKYDFKLTISDDAESYAECNSSLVGGANVPYYKIDLALEGSYTTGDEKAHYHVNYEELENGWVRATLDFEVSNDIIQWNSLRWLFTAHNIGDLLAIDNVNLYYLSTTPYTNEVVSITINEGDQVLTVGGTKQLTLGVDPVDHDATTFTWASSNTSVATVDQNGLVTATGEGSAEITVTAENGVSASIIVTVTAAAPAGGDNTGLIIGLSVGGGVLVIAIIVAVVIISKKRKA